MGVDKARMQRAWSELADEAFIGMAEWRVQHPKATFREIEAAVDERLAGVRSRMLQDAALASAAAELEDSKCPECGGELRNGGKHSRSLLSNHNKKVTLERRYGVCPECGSGLFPPR